MKNFSYNSILKKASVLRIAPLIIILSIFLSSSFLIPNFNNITEIDREFNNFSQTPLLADADSVLFEGNEISLNITDYGNLYDNNQEVALTDQEELNLTYYLDDVHDWKVSKIETNIRNIQDTQSWVNDSNFESINSSLYTVYETHDTLPHYDNDETKSSSLLTISHTGAIAMRVFFDRTAFEEDYDFIFIEDSNDLLCFQDSGYRNNFYSPWVRGDTIQIYIVSDGSVTDDGYEISSYQYINDSYDTNLWGFNNISKSPTYYGPGYINNTKAMQVSLFSDLWYSGVSNGYYANYSKYDFSEISQNLTIPRGAVINAFISFDYYAEFALESNDFYLYIELNNQEIYSVGFGDIIDAGKHKWHSTGNKYMDLWLNNTKLFENNINSQELNISFGIKSRSSAYYQGFIDRFQQTICFDNLSLTLTTIANSSQSDINLTINGYSLNQSDQWGAAKLNITGIWDSDPIVLIVNTSSPSLYFELDTKIYGYHETFSLLGQTPLEGVSYEILENGSIFWEFYHNFYMPAQYSEFEFLINKPKNWKILSVLDPTFLPVSYEGGDIGDDYVFLNKSSASYPGWWKFIATSPNFIQEENVYISRNDQWGLTDFQTGNTGQIRAQINYSSEIPNGLDQTIVNLTVYDPEGAIWFEDSSVPLVNGTVLFSSFYIATHNSTGGIHNFTIFWGNGTSIGGFKSNFVITHDSYITLLRPEDAKLDNSTGGSVGDIIPLRLFLRDSENGDPISNAILSFNWTNGPIYMVEIGLGIYDAILDTSDLGSLGLYTIIVSSNKIGYENSTFNLEINLGENTILQRLGSDSSIIINANSTITFFYYSEVDDEGITGATIGINITNPIYYSITETSPGTYSIKINTVFLDSIGTYQLLFEFSAPGYEPQSHIYQFKIVNPPSPGGSNPFLILIIIISSAVIIVLGSLSIRSYVILPRKRRKEADLLSRTQRFKDMKNVQAIVVSHRLSGIPLYTKSYSLLEKQKKELFSGFIQAITAIGEEIAGKRITSDSENVKKTAGGLEKLIELDFKYFYCLICDREDLRIVLVLQDRASEQLKEVITNLATSIILNHSDILENWDGSIEIFEKVIPSKIDQYFNFFYKEGFILNNPEYIANMRKETEFNKMDTRILNTMYSMAKNKSEFYLEDIVSTVHEDNKDLIIDSIEVLIDKKIIISTTN